MPLIRSCLALAAGLAILSAQPARAQSIVGHWKLVEQTYGGGRSNLIDDEAQAFRLEFFREGADLRARIRVGGRSSASLSWPRLVADDARAAHVLEQRVSTGESGVFVRYRVDPPADDDLVLEVTEEYRVGEDASTLSGTIGVRFERDGQSRGSYVLHRRFVRDP